MCAPVNAEFIYFAMAFRQTGALIKTFSWMICFRPAGRLKVSARVFEFLNSTEAYVRKSNILLDNHPWEQKDECKTKNHQM